MPERIVDGPGLAGPATAGVSVAVIAAAVLGLCGGSPNPLAAVCAPVALALLIGGLDRCSGSSLLYLALASGAVFGCASAPWLPEAFRTLGSSSAEAYWGWLLAGAYSQVPVLVPAAVSFRLTRRTTGNRFVHLAALAVPIAFFEWLHTQFLGGLPWSFIGHSQIGSIGVAQLAAVGGVPLVSAAVVSLSFLLHEACSHPRHPTVRRAAIAAAGGWAALAIFGLPVAELARSDLQGSSHTALLIQPNIDRSERQTVHLQELNLHRLARQTAAALEASFEPVDLIYWPEGSLVLAVANRDRVLDALVETVEQLSTPVILGVTEYPRRSREGDSRNYVLEVHPDVGVTARYDKTIPVPLVESAANVVGEGWLRWTLGKAGRRGLIQPSTEPDSTFSKFSAIPALCFEVLFPGEVEKRRGVGNPKVIANLADDSWVSGDRATVQLATFARFRAIEQRLPLVRVSHDGLSVVVDEFGRVVHSLPERVSASHVVRFRLAEEDSAIARASILVIPIVSAILAWLCIPWLSRGVESRVLPKKAGVRRVGS